MALETSEPVLLETAWGELRATHLRDTYSEGVMAYYWLPEDGELLVRIHSSCLFSESLGAIDCDCNWQLKEALRMIAERGGVLIYLYEEGRGTGLRSKFEAIRLQQTRSMSTAEAFAELGLHEDPRRHGLAATALQRVAPNRAIRLLTNNPRKVTELEAQGVNVRSREALVVQHHPLMVSYLQEKAEALGHDVS